MEDIRDCRRILKILGRSIILVNEIIAFLVILFGILLLVRELSRMYIQGEDTAD